MVDAGEVLVVPWDVGVVDEVQNGSGMTPV
jgi:hypothetical protein